MLQSKKKEYNCTQARSLTEYALENQIIAVLARYDIMTVFKQFAFELLEEQSEREAADIDAFTQLKSVQLPQVAKFRTNF